MFPSGNYFREIPCPFYSRVTCPRPHCHFKHVHDSSQSTGNSNTPSSSSSTAINIPPDANETLNKLINQLSSAAAANSTATTTTNPTPSVDLTSILQSTLLQSLSSVLANALQPAPQPTNNTNHHEVAEKPAQPPKTNDTVPQYRPTPIAELERRRRIQQQPSVKTTVKTEPLEFDSDDYVQATFSPPADSPPPASSHPSEPVEEPTLKVPDVPKLTPSVPSNTLPKQSLPSTTDDNHSWVTPPARRKVSSSSDYHDVDERKSGVVKKVAPFEKTPSSTTIPSKPTATVKPNVIENTNRVTTTTDPSLRRIPKKPLPSKVRVADIDLEKVPVTSSLSLDIERKPKKTGISPSLKRSSTGTSAIPQKKPKLIPTPTIPKRAPITSENTNADEDEELALFDQAFSAPKPPSTSTIPKKTTPTLPPTSIQQFTSRYPSLPNVANDSNASASTNRTRAETSIDGRRVAHQPKAQPTSNHAPAPTVFQPLVDSNTSVHKIPFKSRQEYLTFFLNELKKRPASSNDATPIQSRAQKIEKEIFDKSTNKNSYLNLAAKYLRQLRSDEPPTRNPTDAVSTKKTNAPRLVVSHSAMLTGGSTDNLSFGIKKKKDIDIKTLTDNELYTFLLVYKASDRDLIENGYPAFSLDFPDKVLIKNKNPIYNSTIKLPSSDPFTRICCRCSKTYRINKDGEYLTQEQCIYHWGRLLSRRIAGQIEKTYTCCSSKSNTVGCAVSPYHVHDGDETQLLSSYVKTQPLRKTLPPEESYGIFALDCEMCYTINGLELVRVSVVNHKLQSVYESFVKPHDQILDYNTRWSGITEKHLENCHVTFEDVQRRLLKLFNSKTILIGHSLESDLKALKIVHETVVDTSLVFPHPKGLPYKRALKTLMSEYLTKIIQENAEGHDSVEDSISCMELMLWKIAQDLKSSSSTR